MTLVPYERTRWGTIYINLERYQNMLHPEAHGNPVQIRQQTVSERIDTQITEFRERLSKLQQLKKLLDENPVHKEVLSLTSELGLGQSF